MLKGQDSLRSIIRLGSKTERFSLRGHELAVNLSSAFIALEGDGLEQAIAYVTGEA